MFTYFRLDADLLAGEMTEEFESLKKEFAQHEAVMKDLERQAAEYRERGNIEAADRLDQQILLLKVCHVYVVSLYPFLTEYDPRMC